MARHRDGDDELEAILEQEDPAAPATTDRQPRRSRRLWPVGLVLALVLVAVGLLGGWQLGARTAADTAEVSSATPPSTWPPLTTTAPPLPPEAWAGEDDHRSTAFPHLRLLGTRVSAEGITIRSLLPGEDEGCGEADWCPPAECRSGTGLVVELSTEQMVGTGWSARYPEVVAPPLHVAGWAVVGVSEGDPVGWVAVRVPFGTAGVELVDGDVVRDRAGVTEGWAALAAPPGDDTYDPGWTVVALDKAGRELGRTGLEYVSETDVALPEQCVHPGPPLPPPGEPPPDPEGARRAIEETYRLVWEAGHPRNQKLAAITDTAGVESAMDRIASRYPDSVRTTEVELGEVVFTSPVQAQLHFEITFGSGSSLGKRVGGAAFIDGRWQVLRSTVCDVLAAAGATCSWS